MDLFSPPTDEEIEQRREKRMCKTKRLRLSSFALVSFFTEGVDRRGMFIKEGLSGKETLVGAHLKNDVLELWFTEETDDRKPEEVRVCVECLPEEKGSTTTRRIA